MRLFKELMLRIHFLELAGKRLNYLCCAKIPFSFEVDRYNGQPANNRLTFIYALLPEKEPPAIVGLETAVEMNLVRLELCATVFQVDGNCSV